jgi:hypothetical protein
MAIRKNRFYRSDLGPKVTQKELDLRKEVKDTFKGSIYEIPKSFKVMLRKFRRNANNYRVPCSCNVAKEGQGHQKCTICLGEGYLWDEHYMEVFKVDIGSDQEKAGASLITEIGRTKKQFCKFYVQSSIVINYEDRVIELELDEAGVPVKPEKRKINWTINTLNEKRSDTGRIEYIILYCRKY